MYKNIKTTIQKSILGFLLVIVLINYTTMANNTASNFLKYLWSIPTTVTGISSNDLETATVIALIFGAVSGTKYWVTSAADKMLYIENALELMKKHSTFTIGAIILAFIANRFAGKTSEKKEKGKDVKQPSSTPPGRGKGGGGKLHLIVLQQYEKTQEKCI